jgi:hypothetical protein
VAQTLPTYNPIYYTTARDPTEIMRTTDGKYRIADGVSSGTELWEAETLDGVFGNTSWTRVGMLQTNSIHSGYWYAPTRLLVPPHHFLVGHLLSNCGVRECPDFFRLPGGLDGATWVSKFSQGGDWYTTGSYDEPAGTFSPFADFKSLGQPAMYDTNQNFYVSKSSFFSCFDVLVSSKTTTNADVSFFTAA